MFTLPFGYVLLLNAICSASSWFIWTHSFSMGVNGCKATPTRLAQQPGDAVRRGQVRFLDNNASENL